MIFCLLLGFASPFLSPPSRFLRRGRCFDAIVGSNGLGLVLGFEAGEGFGGVVKGVVNAFAA